MNSDKISVTIITKNSKATLKQCILSVKDFDEIIMLDNGSIDGTIELVKEMQKELNLKIKTSEFIGFGKLKNLAASYARNDWIFSLDSDEILEKTALDSIKNTKLENNMILSLGRKNLYNGEWIKACGWYPDYVSRIYNKKFTEFKENMVHESLLIPSNANIFKIDLAINHYTASNIDSIINKMNSYTTLNAKQKKEKGGKASLARAFIRFFLIFIKDYFFRSGFKYGYKGFVIALLNASGGFFKYMKLYELIKNENDKNLKNTPIESRKKI